MRPRPPRLDAAIRAQRNLQAEDWGESGPIRVRMALHTGVTEERGDDYVGPLLNRVARVLPRATAGRCCSPRPPTTWCRMTCRQAPPASTWASTA